MLAAAALAEGAVTGVVRKGPLTLLTLSDGAAEVSWLSDSSFRFTRCWQSACLSRQDADASVELKFREAAGELIWETPYVRLRMKRVDVSVTVENAAEGRAFLSQGPVKRASPAGLEVAITPAAAERLYGLNAGKMDVRGEVAETAAPFLMSAAGYGLHFGMPGMYRFDLTAGIAVRNIQARQWEQFFYYGPTPKEILEEHHAVRGAIRNPKLGDLRGKPDYGRNVRGFGELAAASMSGVLVPLVADELAWKSFAPGREWDWYLYTYLCEARDRGLPVIRPLAMQYPEDAEGALLTDEFLLGDEVLVAAGQRTYLPRGVWTDLRTGERHRGRQWVETPAPPRLFARNGTILPMLAGEVTELHYFPKLGAEFFLSEPPAGDFISQMHAGPAGDILRLEIEAKAERRYEWVVHHVPDASAVTAVGGDPPPWRYDPVKRELRVPAAAAEGANVILNVTLAGPLE